MSDSDDDAHQEQKLKQYRDRLQKAAQKHAVELDSAKKQRKSGEKYDNPFARDTTSSFDKQKEDDDFNDRDFEFKTDEIMKKSKAKTQKHNNFGGEENTSSNVEKEVTFDNNK